MSLSEILSIRLVQKNTENSKATQNYSESIKYPVLFVLDGESLFEPDCNIQDINGLRYYDLLLLEYHTIIEMMI